MHTQWRLGKAKIKEEEEEEEEGEEEEQGKELKKRRY
jgi:hypothetical protein